jgi:hypothetical protein
VCDCDRSEFNQEPTVGVCECARMKSHHHDSRRSVWIWPFACIPAVNGKASQSSGHRASQVAVRYWVARWPARCRPSAFCYCLQRRPRLRPYRCVDCYSTQSLRPTAGCLAGRHSQTSGLTSHITSLSSVEISESTRASEVANQSQPGGGEGRGARAS